MKNNKVPLIDYIFSSEYDNYLLLEDAIFKLFDLYKNHDELKKVLRNSIKVAKGEIKIMLEIISHTVKDEKIRELEATLCDKFVALESIERYLIVKER